MGKILKNTWALFTGIGIILLANGLQGNLMGVRSVIENFSSLSTGIIMSGYFVGYFVGSNLTPNMVSRVGHIRVFAAFCFNSIIKHFNYCNICKSCCLDIRKILNRAKFSKLLYRSRKLA